MTALAWIGAFLLCVLVAFGWAAALYRIKNGRWR